jgi:hypothetical protein
MGITIRAIGRQVHRKAPVSSTCRRPVDDQPATNSAATVKSALVPGVQAGRLELEIPRREVGIRVQIGARTRPGMPGLRRVHDTVCHDGAVFANNV